jgi:hypothetical protein
MRRRFSQRRDLERRRPMLRKSRNFCFAGFLSSLQARNGTIGCRLPDEKVV